jgi:hypothetical protein
MFVESEIRLPAAAHLLKEAQMYMREINENQNSNL